VYLFYGPERELLYVGKSINIKRRVQSHFSSDHGQSRRYEMVQQIHDIEAQVTVSDLAASLLELQLIKTREPLYNRASRRYRKLWALIETKDDKGYLGAVVTPLGTITPQMARSIVGLFRSRRKAIEFRRTLTKEHQLCSKRMGDESGRGRCFLAQTDICAGACIGQELPRDYNRRVRQAFKARRVRQWPYRGPVILREGLNKNNKGELFIIDQWCLVAAFQSDENGTRPFLETLSGTFFEFDTYKVLSRHLLQARHTLEVVTTDQIPSLVRTELGIVDYRL
jgi:DNA polymerase-3 subunit epsilon